MNKTFLKLFLRKSKRNFKQLIGIALLIIVGTAFFVTMSNIKFGYEQAAKKYFIDNKYADITFYGSFTQSDVDLINAENNISLAVGRNAVDFRVDDTIIRVISLTEGVNLPHIYNGSIPQSENQCLIVQRNANALKMIIGDTITVQNKNLTIVGTMDSPEYIYLAKNERTPMADSKNFITLYVDASFFGGNFNEIVALGSDLNANELATKVSAQRAITMKNQLNYILYFEDLDQIGMFRLIFPIIFALLIVVIIFVSLKRTVVKEHKLIGICKALGISNSKILLLYAGQFVLTSLLAGIVGCLVSIFTTNIMINLFASMFVVPSLSFIFYPVIWILAVSVAIVVSLISGIISLAGTLKIMPSESMRPVSPKNGKKLKPKKLPFYNKASFNTRYALKSTLRNKGRFFSVILGVCGACALLVFSFGFGDSIVNTGQIYFKDFANYDIIASFDPIPRNMEHAAGSLADTHSNALQFYAEIKGEQTLLTMVEDNFNMLDIPTQSLKNGVILPDYFARLWGVKVGDFIEINGYNVEISEIIYQTFNLSVYVGFDYAENVMENSVKFYNTIFIRSENLEPIVDYLRDNNITYSTIADDESMFLALSENLQVMLLFMLVCAIILGVTVLYSVGIINLNARQYEYMFMGIMGYSHKSIMQANIKEQILQLALAVPMGFLLGNLILNLIKDAFSGAALVLAPAIYLPSYLFSTAIIFAMSTLMLFATSRQIKKLDIVEGLKVQDE